jgi:S-adenosylmethionine:diacylglycerol 3-amino-3-carboxypropyl transferase
MMLMGPPPAAALPVWERGRFDARAGQGRVLFGRMYEDPAIELAAFPPGGRAFCIASAGCTAMALAPRQSEVVAVDVNPVQLAYAGRRLAGAPGVRGTAERVMAFGRALAPLLGWTRGRVRAFLELDDPAEQAAYWRRHLDTRRFRAVLDGLLSVTALRAVYASPLLAFLPRRLGAVLRGRLARGIGRHPNRTNPYARALFLGEMADTPPPPEAARVRLVLADAASYLEGAPAGSFDGVTLSNILDGADPRYRERLFGAVRRAAAPGAMVVLRSFAEPDATADPATNRAADDRAMLWGIVDVRRAADLSG